MVTQWPSYYKIHAGVSVDSAGLVRGSVSSHQTHSKCFTDYCRFAAITLAAAALPRIVTGRLMSAGSAAVCTGSS